MEKMEEIETVKKISEKLIRVINNSQDSRYYHITVNRVICELFKAWIGVPIYKLRDEIERIKKEENEKNG